MTPAAPAPPETPEVPPDVMDALQNAPIIEIDTLDPERGEVSINGELYEIKLLAEYGIADQHRLKRELKQYDDLWKKGSLTAKEEKQLKARLDHIFTEVLIAPKELKAKVKDQGRQQVVMAFTLAPLVQEAAREAKEIAERQEARSGSTSET